MRTTDFCPSLESNGHPDPLGFRVLSRRTGADGASRRRCALRWFRPVSIERFLLVEVRRFDATSDTPVALRATYALESKFSYPGPALRRIPGSHVLEEPRPTRHARRESYVTTPARDAFVLCPARILDCSSTRDACDRPPIARRWVDDATRHMIRSHSRTLVSSRVILSPPSRHALVGHGSAPDHADPLPSFVSAELNGSVPRAPSQP